MMSRSFLILFLFCLLGCTKEQRIELHYAFCTNKYQKDAYYFLKKNYSDLELTNQQDLLIQDIENAIDTYEGKLICDNIPFDVFCEYTLPLQLFNEPVEDWRRDCMGKYEDLKILRTIETCDSINNRFKENFKFGKRTSLQFKSWTQLKEMQQGDCYDMTQAVVYPLRALGIPTTIDVIHGWGNTNGTHTWNVVYVDGKMRPFMGIEEGPETYNPFLVYKCIDDSTRSSYRYPPKIYRKTPIKNKEFIEIRTHLNDENCPNFLIDYRVKDVTEEYFNVCNVSLSHNLFTNETKVAYLSIYNTNQWKPIAASIVEENKPLIFKNMRPNMLYLPSKYTAQIKAIDYPFILDEDNRYRILKPKLNIRQQLTIDFLQPLLLDYLDVYVNVNSLPENAFQQMSTNNSFRKRPQAGKVYKLYYWEYDGWEKVGESIAGKNIHFSQIPSNALLQLADQKYMIGRPFTIENNEMVWW